MKQPHFTGSDSSYVVLHNFNVFSFSFCVLKLSNKNLDLFEFPCTRAIFFYFEQPINDMNSVMSELVVALYKSFNFSLLACTSLTCNSMFYVFRLQNHTIQGIKKIQSISSSTKIELIKT